MTDAEPIVVTPVVEEFRFGGRREAHIHDVYEADGVSGYSLYDPDNPPHEVSYSGGGGSLDLAERQARQVYARLGELIGKWDAPAVKMFHEKRPRYQVDHIIMIAREAGENGLPFCNVCVNWHEKDGPHTDEKDIP